MLDTFLTLCILVHNSPQPLFTECFHSLKFGLWFNPESENPYAGSILYFSKFTSKPSLLKKKKESMPRTPWLQQAWQKSKGWKRKAWREAGEAEQESQAMGTAHWLGGGCPVFPRGAQSSWVWDLAATADDPLLNTELSSLSQHPHSIQEVKTSPLDLRFIQLPTLSTSLNTFQGLVSSEVPN